MAKKPQSRNKSGRWTKLNNKTRSITQVKSNGKSFTGISKEAREFSRRFDEQYRETLRDLSKR